LSGESEATGNKEGGKTKSKRVQSLSPLRGASPFDKGDINFKYAQ